MYLCNGPQESKMIKTLYIYIYIYIEEMEKSKVK